MCCLISVLRPCCTLLIMLLTMTSVLPSSTNFNYSSRSLTSSPSSRPRTATNHQQSSTNWSSKHQGIRKTSHSRTHSPSLHSVRNFEGLTPEQIFQGCNQSPGATYSSTYSASPRLSPQPRSHFEPVESDSAFAWSMPTPPRSESGAASRSSVTAAGSYPLAATTSSPAASSTRPSMSTLGYMGQPQYQQYGHDGQLYSSSGYSYDQGYRVQAQHTSQSYDLSGAGASYNQSHPRTSSQSSGYQQSDPSMSTHNPYALGYAQPPSTAQRSMSSPMPATTMGLVQSKYANSYVSERSPSLYDPRYYASPVSNSQALPPPSSSTGLGYSMPQYGSAAPSQAYQRSDSIASASSSSAKASNPKEKPQCWEHGCNGREFSTFSNLLRHQREKSGTASKSYCPRCGAEFTRTTARNGHLAHDKCTKRRASDDDK